ncbi:hypothetical protein PMAYCL1PPCAC_30215, partial [Pristionchus mayeri]
GEYGSLLVRECIEYAQCTAEAVVERIGNADDMVPVVVVGTNSLRVGVVEEIVMSESRPLRGTNTYTRVLYVDGIIYTDRLLDGFQSILRSRPHSYHEILVLPCSLHILLFPEENDVLEVRNLPALDMTTASLRRGKIRDDIMQSAIIVALLVCTWRDQTPDAHLLKSESQFLRLIRGIY